MLTGLVISYVGTAIQTHVAEGKIEGMGRQGRRHQQLLGTLRKRQGTGTWKKKHFITVLGEFTVEEGLLQDRLHNECVCFYRPIY